MACQATNSGRRFLPLRGRLGGRFNSCPVADAFGGFRWGNPTTANTCDPDLSENGAIPNPLIDHVMVFDHSWSYFIHQSCKFGPSISILSSHLRKAAGSAWPISHSAPTAAEDEH